MNDGQVRLGMILVYFALLVVLGFLASRFFRGTKQDYLLASHSIGPFLLLMSLFGTTMTAFALVGSSGESYQKGVGVYGMLASASGIVHSLCFFVVGVKLWSLGRRHGYSTQIQFFRDRLDSDLVGLLLFPILVGLIIPYLLLGVMAGGGVIQAMTAGAFPDWALFDSDNAPLDGGVPKWLGSLLICAVVLIYVYFGGMRGTAWANAFQTLVFMSLGVVTFVVIANKLGGGETLLDSLKNITGQVDTGFLTRSKISQSTYFSYLLIPLSIGMFPHIFQHWLTAKSARSFKVPVICHPIFVMIVWAPCVLIGIWATTQEIPAGITPNQVLPFLVNREAAPVLAGLLTAGILAAIMSSLDSQFLCIGSIFTNDIVGHYLGTNRLSDRAQVWIARGFVILIVGVTYVLSLQGYRSVFVMGIWCFTGFAALFPLVFAALYWRQLTKWGAVAGILATICSWLYLFRQSNWGSDGDFAVRVSFGEINLEFLPVVAVFLCSTVAMVGVSLITKAPSDKTLQRFFP